MNCHQIAFALFCQLLSHLIYIYNVITLSYLFATCVYSCSFHCLNGLCRLCDFLKCIFKVTLSDIMLSVLWLCWLDMRKSIRPVEIERWGVGVVICLERGADCLHMVQLMPLPSPNLTISCLNWIQTSFTSLLPAYPGWPGKEAVKQV